MSFILSLSRPIFSLSDFNEKIITAMLPNMPIRIDIYLSPMRRDSISHSRLWKSFISKFILFPISLMARI